MRVIIPTFFLLSVVTSSVIGQSLDSTRSFKTKWFLSGGIGTGSKILALNSGLYVLPNRLLAFGLKYSKTSEIHLFRQPDAYESDFSLLVGFTHTLRNHRLIIMGGYSRVTIVQTFKKSDNESSFFETEEDKTNGVALNVQALILNNRNLDLSFNGFATLNHIKSFGGITLNLNIGFLKD